MEEKTKELLSLLKKRGLTLSSMESLTGGMFASEITAVPGASSVFKGSIVSYCDSVKESFGVEKDIIEKYGAISKECADSMARTSRRWTNSDISVSFTGNAGPDGQEGKKVGLVYMSICLKDILHSYEFELSGTREEIRRELVFLAIKKIKQILEEN